MAARIGIDTGGTFTDVVRWSPRGLHVHKLPSTPDDPGRAVLEGVRAVRRTPDEAVDVVHGTTVGVNAVLQGRLPRTVFVTNRGFRDLIEIGRQQRTELYALEPDRPVPPVPRQLRVEVDCRRDADGRVVVPLTGAAIARTVRAVRALRPAAVAIGLLHAPADPVDERRLGAALRRALPDVPVTASAGLLPAFGEYERFCAAILNAAITPLIGDYTERLLRRLGPGRLRLMRSSLGILPPDEARAYPARAMFSGPAGGALATARLCRAAGYRQAAALDMGGTSTDVCLVHDGNMVTDHGAIAGLPLPLPAVDVHTIGCGGGSIAYVDRGGALCVGPQSAGAVPGPACYGRGDEPTVTDAHMVLGHMGNETLLGGAFPVDVDCSVRAVERLARRLGVATARAAAGILAIADVHMVRALMVITVERTIDPARVPLIAYGGAGGLHAANLRARLGMPVAVIPAHPGAFSAVGLALAGESAELLEAVLQPLTDALERDLHQRARALGRAAAASLGVAPGRATASVTLRYRGQGGGLRLRLRAGQRLRAAFLQEHARRFGFAPDAAVEIVGLTARAEAPGKTYPMAPAGRDQRPARPKATRPAPVQGQALRVFDRGDLPAGQCVHGPCLIEEATAVTWVPGGSTARATQLGLELYNRPIDRLPTAK